MTDDSRKTKAQLIEELQGLRQRVDRIELPMRDISELKQAAEAQRKAHENLAATLNVLPDLLFEVDRDGRIYDFRAPNPDLLYVPPEEFLGKTMFEILPADATKVIAHAIDEAAKTGQHRGGVYCLQMADGLNWFELSIAAKNRNTPATRFIMLVRDITERKQAEEVLRERELHFRTLAESIPQKVFLKDVHSSFVAVNAHFAKELGVTPQEVVGRNDYDFSPAEMAKKYQADDQRVMASGKTEEFEEEHIENGEVRFVHTVKAPVTDSEGNVSGVFGIFWDVTSQRRAEEALRKSEERLQLAMSVANDGLWDYNFKTGAVHYDPRFFSMAGYEVDEFPHKYEQVRSRIHPDDLESVKAAIDAHIRGETDRLVTEFRFLRKERNWMWLLGRGKIVERDENGGPVRFVGTHTDITERKQAEEALRESEAILRRFASNIPGIASILNAEGVFQLSEGRGLADLGLTSDQVVGRSVSEVFRHVPQVQKDVRRGLAGEEFMSTAQLGPLTFETYYVPLRKADGSTAGLLGIANNVTERKRAEEQRLLLERQVQHAQKLESLGVLAGGIAHDFNNLLMAILGNADLALHELSPMSPARENILEIEKASRRAAELAKQMLAYSGKGRFVIEPIILGELVEEMTHLLEVSISKKVVLKYNFAQNLPLFDGDVTQIRQIIMNLITNASEAIGDKSGVIALSTGAMNCDRAYLEGVNDMARAGLSEPLSEGVYVYLEVADTGCGMSSETVSKIFDPFFTTKFTGRGLGMSAVLGIVRGHKGTIKIYSEPGKGTTFKVLFPANQLEENGQTARWGNMDWAIDWRGEGTILIADDEETVCAVGKQLLERLGFEVLTAADGQSAVDLFRQHAGKIVCVLLDLTMPHLDGAQAFSEIRRIRPDAAVILCSGYNEQDATQRFCGKGLSGFLQKPYNMSALREKLRGLLPS